MHRHHVRRVRRDRFRTALLAPVLLVVVAAGLSACEIGVDCDGEVYFAGANLSGTDQSGKQLMQCDLSGINFAGASFADASLGNADLTGADLSGADFDGADLKNAILVGTNVAGAEFGAVDNVLVSSGGVTGTPASLPVNWTLTGGFFVGPGVNLVGADLSGVDLSSTNLTFAFLTDANLAGADLRYTTLTDSTLEGAALGSATLDHVTSGGIEGTPESLPDGWQLIDGTLVGPETTDGETQVTCPEGQSCSSAPITRNGTTVSASFGPGGSAVTLALSINPSDAPAFSCDAYPQPPNVPIIEFYFTGGDASDRLGTLTATYESEAEPDLSQYQVCWAAPYPFVAQDDGLLAPAQVQGVKPGTGEPLYVGVLADCDLGNGYFLSAPCISDISWEYTSGVTVAITTTGADPWRY